MRANLVRQVIRQPLVIVIEEGDQFTLCPPVQAVVERGGAPAPKWSKLTTLRSGRSSPASHSGRRVIRRRIVDDHQFVACW